MIPEGRLILDYVCWWIGFLVVLVLANLCLAWWPVETLLGILVWFLIEVAVPRS